MVARVNQVLHQAARQAPPFWVNVPAFAAFADEVVEALQAGELPFAARVKLMRRADHHGLRRFDANLIIAMVQNRMGETKLIDEAEPHGTWLFPVAIAVTIQAIITLGIWILVYG